MSSVALFLQMGQLSFRRKPQLFSRERCSQCNRAQAVDQPFWTMVPKAVDATGRSGTAVKYTVHGSENLALAKHADLVGFIGTKDALSSDIVAKFIRSLSDFFPRSDIHNVWDAALSQSNPGDFGSSTTMPYAVDGKLRFMYLGVIPDPANLSRHNACYAVNVVTPLTSSAAICTKAKDGLLIYVAESHQLYAIGCAAARAFPIFSRKTKNAAAQPNITISLCGINGEDISSAFTRVASAATSIREVACMGDMPADVMSPQMFVVKAEKVRDDLKALGKDVDLKVLRMKELVDGGFGGIVGVGQGASAAGPDREPALIHLSFVGSRSEVNSPKWCLVGKGIVFDTGGLHIKSRLGMNSMKADMLGAAAQLYAFKTAVETGAIENGRLDAVLCVAENSVSAWSYRPDDVLTMHSGRTVEINNSDAEGRLVLSDGVSYAALEMKPDFIVTTATLTGAQGVATGKRHCAVMSTSEALEKLAVDAGKRSGDCVFPVLYLPELLKKEFSSKVADMVNSVKDRANAQVSCAGQFIANHLPSDFLENGGHFAHLDIAGPATADGRATGFGVALLVDMIADMSTANGK